MWILQFLPDWVFHAICLAGIAGLVAGVLLGFLPIIGRYKLPIQIISLLLLVFGLFMEGAITNEQVWQARVKELEAKIAESEKKVIVTNTKIKKVYVTKVKVIKQDKIVIQDRIIKEAAVIDKDCKISPSAISILNEAAKPIKATVTVEPLKKDDKQ
jgi:ribosomal protein L24